MNSLAAHLIGMLRTRLSAIKGAGPDHRGAVLIMLAVGLTAVGAAGAIAVDLTNLDREGAKLQAVADAGALAGVDSWVADADKTKARKLVKDVVRQNGLLGKQAAISFPSSSEVKVRVTADQNTLLAGLLGFHGGPIVRSATAELTQCDCEEEFEIAPPLSTVAVQGSGDGFLPILHDDRVFALNHSHSGTLDCVDLVQAAPCWPSKPRIFPTSAPGYPYFPGMNPRVHTIGNRIYGAAFSIHAIANGTWTGNPGTSLVQCWNITTNQSCGGVARVDVGDTNLAGVGDKVYTFDADRRVRCYTATLGLCAGYGADGKPTAMFAHPDFDYPDTYNYASDWIELNGRIYVTLSDNGRDFLHCWDTNTEAACSGFGTHHLNGSREMNNSQPAYTWHWDNLVVGRLFFNRDGDGVPNAICSLGTDEIDSVDCFDLASGNHLPGVDATLVGWADSIVYTRTGSIAEYHSGLVAYHTGSNRIFAPGTWPDSTTYCFDFDTVASCGSMYNTTSFGAAETYGYLEFGSCMLGLGHQSIFFAFRADMSGSCEGGTSTVEISPCPCGANGTWPAVLPDEIDGVTEFRARALDEDGNQIAPLVGWVDLLSDSLDLSSVSTSAYPTLTLEFEVEGPNWVWADGQPPVVVITASAPNTPVLTS